MNNLARRYFMGGGVQADPTESFIITVSVSAGGTFTLPLVSNGTYDFTADWGDGTSDVITTYNQAEITHTYSVAGSYDIDMNGVIEGWLFNNSGDKLKIIDVKQFGGQNGVKFTTSSVFYGCSNLDISATDIPNLSLCENFEFFFANCNSLVFNSSINDWDLSGITFYLSNTFLNTSNFNQPLNNWDVSNITKFDNTFRNSGFNQPLNNWSVSNAIRMDGMFRDNTSFNQNIGAWNVGNVDNFSAMFYNATSFNNGGSSDINNWDLSSAIQMNAMLRNTPFNQPIGSWNTLNCSIFAGFLQDANLFDQDLSLWNVSSCSNFDRMFSNTSFNNGGQTGIDNWNVSSANRMIDMFQNSNFNQPIGSWNVSSVTRMDSIFRLSDFNQNINDWDVSSVINFNSMFAETPFNQPLNNWNTANCSNFTNMFFLASSFNQDIGGWNVSNMTVGSAMFRGATSFNNGGSSSIGNWNTQNLEFTIRMFQNCDSFDQNIGNWNISSLINANLMFLATTLSTANYDALLIGWEAQKPNILNDVSFDAGNSQYTLGGAAETARNNLTDPAQFNWEITDGGGVLGADPTESFIITVDVGAGDTFTLPLVSNGTYDFTADWGDGTSDVITAYNQAEVTHTYSVAGSYDIEMNGVIEGWGRLASVDRSKILKVKQWGTVKFLNQPISFDGCINLDVTAQDIPDLTQSTNLAAFFRNCSSLIGNSSFNNWDVSNVTSFSATVTAGMFEGCTNFNQNIGDWIINAATFRMRRMFLNSGFNNGGSPDIQNWNVSGVEDVVSMFQNSPFNQPINNWNASFVDMTSMFQNSSFDQNIGSWDMSNVVSLKYTFSFCNFNNGGSSDINNWNLGKCSDFVFTFRNNPSFNQPIGGWTLGTSVSSFDMAGMFRDANAFNQNVGTWDMSKCSRIGAISSGMFLNAISFNNGGSSDINNWDITGLTGSESLQNVFNGCLSFDQPLNNWDVSNVTSASNFLNGATLSTANYDALLIGWEAQLVQNNVTFNGGNSQYTAGSAAATARQNLITDHSWTITDGGGI